MLSLGIDIGTSGVRSAVLDGSTLVVEARAPHVPQSKDQIDANGWWAALETCLHTQMTALKEAGRDPREIAGIAVDGTSGSMVLTDAALAPVSPALMYNSKGFDKEAARIDALVAGPHITKGSNSALARAMRLVSMAAARPAHLMHQADFISSRLLGRAGGSDYNNALKTGFDPEMDAWPEWIGGAISLEVLPKVASPGTALGEVSAATAQTFGLSAGTQVFAGTTDSIAAFLAASPLALGNAVTSLGSTLAIKLLSPTRIDDPAIGLYSHRLGDAWLVGGASNTGGAVLKAHFEDAALRRLSDRIDPSKEHDLGYYPLLEPGERFPVNDPNLVPVLTPRSDADHDFLHAMLEGMARIEAACYREMSSRGALWPTQIFTAGGGAQNETWRLIRARHLGLSPAIAAQSDAAIGAAKLAQT